MTQTNVAHFSVHCRGCDRTVSVASPNTRFCPQCGHRLRRAPWPAVAVMVATLVAIVAGSRLWFAPAASPAPVVTMAVTGPVAEILAAAEADRNAQLDDLHQRLVAVRAAHKDLVAQADDLANVSARITAAVARANDEDRWPMKVAGRTMDRAEADALIAKVGGVLATERRAIDRDADVLSKITSADAAVRGELTEIDRLRTQGASADVQRQAEGYRGRSLQVPDPSQLVPDPTRPVDVAALLK